MRNAVCALGPLGFTVVLLCATSPALAQLDALSEPVTRIARRTLADRYGTGSPYALDAEPRKLRENHELSCARDRLVRHRSRALRYAVTADVDFVVRLQRFEALVLALASQHYGRPPTQLIHRGAFACRPVRHHDGHLSEHALGNAIDVRGFEFGPLPKHKRAPRDMPNAMRGAFSVRVLSHWAPRRVRHRYHAAFLHRLVEELRVRPDIFRGIVGPPRKHHLGHLHFDAAPARYAMYNVDTPR